MDTGPRALAYQDDGEVFIVMVLNDDEERDIVRELGWVPSRVIRVQPGVWLRIRHRADLTTNRLP